MTACRILLLVLLLLPAGARAAPGGFDTELAARVFTAALEFIAPRTLDPTTPGELSVWGLRGITANEPGLIVSLGGGRLRLLAGERELFSAAAPPEGDAAAWGLLDALVEQAAFNASAAIRQGGTQGVIQGFFDELFNHLDPYSRYTPPEPAQAERDRLSGQAGAGLELGRRRGAVVVLSVVPDGPAEAAGVRVGDRVLAVDGRSTRGADPRTVLGWLSGDEGTPVTLRLLGLDGIVRRVTLTLALVPPETVAGARDGDLLLISVSAFVANTAERLSQVLEAGLVGPHPPRAVTLDLRGNRGGLLRQAVTAVALLADHGIVARTAGRAPLASHDWRIEGGDLTHGLPVLVLVDGRTASAAEIVAAAIADLSRGVVIGSDTLGKGLVQTITRLPDGGELFVTWSRVLAPRGWPIQGLGVLPQVCTSRGEEETERELQDLDQGRNDMAEALAAFRAARAPLPPARVLELRAPCPAAEGTERDLVAAHFLATHPNAYATALLPPAEPGPAPAPPAPLTAAHP